MTIELTTCDVDLTRRRIRPHDTAAEERALTEIEARLLGYLADRAGRVVSRQELLTEVWGFADRTLSRACDNGVRRLRTKIERDPSAPDHVLTVHGEGYRFVPLAIAETGEPVAAAPSALVHLGRVVLDLGKHELRRDGVRERLTAQEVGLLQGLLEARGNVVSRTELRRRAAVNDGALNNAVQRLRAKLESDPTAPRWLHTHRGEGYRLVLPDLATVTDTPSSFVGRADLLRALATTLGEARWTVLLGPGGVGKTRLARHFAASRSEPAWWVETAEVSDVEALCARVAVALEVPVPRSAPVSTVGRALAARGEALLCLDDLEHGTRALADALPHWLDAAPRLRILGTSRVRPGLPGEHALDVGPLDTDSAVDLFAARARARAPELRLRADDRAIVETLVTRLDAHPLAIELAAARAGVLSPVELLEALGQRLDLLRDGTAATRGRHHALRTTLESSLAPLPERTRRAFLWVSLFRKPFRLAQAHAALGPTAIDDLEALRDHSLLHPRDGGFVVLESLRELAAEQRAAEPDGGAALETSWVASLAVLGDAEHLRTLRHPDRDAALREQNHRRDDLQAAARLALRWKQTDLAAGCAIAMEAGHKPFTAYRELCEAILERGPSPARFARVSLARAHTAALEERRTISEEAFEETLRMTEASGDDELCALAHYQAASTRLYVQGAHDVTRDHFLRASACYARAGLPEWAAYARARAHLTTSSVHPEATPLLQQTVRLARGRDRAVLYQAMTFLGHAYSKTERRPDEALELLEHAEGVARELGTRVGEARAMSFRAEVLVMLGRGDEAAPLYQRVGSIHRALANPSGQLLSCFYQLQSCLARGERDEADLRVAEGRALLADFADRLHPFVVVGFEMATAELALARGRVDLAIEQMQHCRDRFEGLGQTIQVAQADLGLARAFLARGERGRAVEAVEGTLEVLAPQGAHDTAAAWAVRGLVALASGEAAEARRALTEARSSIEAAGYPAEAVHPVGNLVRRLREALDATNPAP
ncbi:MAG: winged helix-turn-helix domain-containing protein [Myxococcota bacterium]